MTTIHKRKTAFITGITGQDGAYLAQFLLEKGYVVHGLQRRTSSPNTARIDHLLDRLNEGNPNLILHYGDMTDSSNLIRLVQEIKPDELYNLAAQSHVHVSFDAPEYTANADGIGALRLLEAIRILGLTDKTRFYQASTSEMYGNAQTSPQNEQTPFAPCSPYAAAKLYAHWITVNYREAYGLYACSGILFNHESPLRGETFVTRKITRAAVRIQLGLQDRLYLGNLDAVRDWGHARDYVEGMWKMLQQDAPDDYVLATGTAETVRRFAELTFAELGIPLEWQGKGLDEIGINAKTMKPVIAIDPAYFRPKEADILIGDPSKAQKHLGWSASTPLKEIVREMVCADLEEARRELPEQNKMPILQKIA